jgi:hypothetical protein
MTKEDKEKILETIRAKERMKRLINLSKGAFKVARIKKMFLVIVATMVMTVPVLTSGVEAGGCCGCLRAPGESESDDGDFLSVPDYYSNDTKTGCSNMWTDSDL